MTGAVLRAAPRCEYDVGGRFTNRPSEDSHGGRRVSACAVASCAAAHRPARAARAAPAVTGATPRPEGLVRHGAERVFTHSHPPPRGRSRPAILSGRVFSSASKAADQVSAEQPSRHAVGIAESPYGVDRIVAPAIRLWFATSLQRLLHSRSVHLSCAGTSEVSAHPESSRQARRS